MPRIWLWEKPVDYELLATNKTDKPIRLPKASAWSEVDNGQREKHYQYMRISFEVFAADGEALGFLREPVTLYGNEARPETLLTVAPGDSVRILGSAEFDPQWNAPPDEETGSRLMAFLTVASDVLQPCGGQDDRYCSKADQVYNLETDGNLSIKFQIANKPHPPRMPSLVADSGKLSATETVINARGARESQSPHDREVFWSKAVNPDTTLEARFTIDDPSLRAGEPVNYELLITNTGERATIFPRALNWKDVVDSGSPELQYVVKASVTLELRNQNAHTYITPTVNLYATAEKTDTLLILRPGDSLRILGRSVLLAAPVGSPSTGPTMLLGHLCVTAVPTKSPTGREVNYTWGQASWCTNADEKYEVNYPPDR